MSQVTGAADIQSIFAARGLVSGPHSRPGCFRLQFVVLDDIAVGVGCDDTGEVARHVGVEQCVARHDRPGLDLLHPVRTVPLRSRNLGDATVLGSLTESAGVPTARLSALRCRWGHIRACGFARRICRLGL